MTLSQRLKITGCKPNVINYLKAIGLFKTIYLQFDPFVKAFFENGNFFIETSLNREELIRCFEEGYQPQPILSPFCSENEFIFKKLEKAKNPRLNTFTQAYETLRESLPRERSRFPSYEWLKDIEENLAELHPALIPSYKAFAIGGYGLSQALSSSTQSHLLANYHSAFTKLGIEENYLTALAMLLDFDSSVPKKDASSYFLTAFFLEPLHTEKKARYYNLGEFTSSLAKSIKDSEVNFKSSPWDYVMALNGFVALCKDYPFFYDIAVPYCLKATSYDWNLIDDNPFRKISQRELWLPLWNKPLEFQDLAKLLLRFSLSLNEAGIFSGLDLVAQGALWGINPILAKFLRVGLNFDAKTSILPEVVDLGQVTLDEVKKPELINPIRAWVSAWQDYLTDGPKSYQLKICLKAVEESLFAYLSGIEGSFTPTLINIGLCQKNASLLPKHKRPHPLVLPSKILEVVLEDSPEFRLALSVASLDSQLPVRRNIEPVVFNENEWIWSDSAELVGGSLVDKLCQLLEMRLNFAKTTNQRTPLTSTYPAKIADIDLFLKGKLDDRYLESLLYGLMVIDYPAPQEAEQQAPTDCDLLSCYLLLRTAFLNSSDFDRLSQLIKRLRFSSLTETLTLTKQLAKIDGFPLPPKFHPSLSLNKRLLAAILFHAI